MAPLVGSDLLRPEGRAKVTGTALYVADLAVEGAWVGGAVRSPVARGRLLALDLDPHFDFDQVVLVRPEDIPGDNVVALIEEDQPILCDGPIQHFGEALALLAAPDADTLRAALAAVTPRIEEEPPVLDMEESTVVLAELAIEKGDVDRAMRDAAVVVEATYHTGTQEQMYIEPQGFVAFPPRADGTVVVEGSLQCPYYVRKSLARVMGVPEARARVIQAETGGGFGGKEDYPSVIACHAALLARQAGRPVRIL